MFAAFQDELQKIAAAGQMPTFWQNRKAEVIGDVKGGLMGSLGGGLVGGALGAGMGALTATPGDRARRALFGAGVGTAAGAASGSRAMRQHVTDQEKFKLMRNSLQR